jgi:hypothetical protein
MNKGKEIQRVPEAGEFFLDYCNPTVVHQRVNLGPFGDELSPGKYAIRPNDGKLWKMAAPYQRVICDRDGNPLLRNQARRVPEVGEFWLTAAGNLAERLPSCPHTGEFRWVINNRVKYAEDLLARDICTANGDPIYE